MISVIIPSHNRPALLKRALQSIHNQTQQPTEVIIIDDASNPPISDKNLKLIPNVKNKKIIRNDFSKMASGSRNTGILNSNSKYVAFLDDDDIFHPKKIEIITSEIQKNNQPDFIFHGGKIIFPNENTFYFTKPKKSHNTNIKELRLGNTIGGTPLVVCKREVLIENGLFNENMPALEDYELWLRIFQNKKYTSHYINQPLSECFYTTRINSVSKNQEKNDSAWEYIKEKHQEIFKTLSKKELTALKENILKDKLQRSIFNYDKKETLKSALEIVKNNPTLNNFIILLVSTLPSKTIIKIRSKL